MKAITFNALVLALMFGGAVHAAQSIDQTRPVEANARIDVSNIKGSLTVSGWNKAEMHVTGTLGNGAKGLKIEGDRGHLTIKVEPPDDHGWLSWGADSHMGNTVLDLKVPHAALLKLETVSADIAVSGIDAKTLDANTVSGKMRVDSSARQVELDSVSGDMDVGGGSDRAHMQTVSGDIRARGLGGDVSFQTVSGNIDAEPNNYHRLDVGTVSGDVTLRGTPAAGAHIGIETMSGDVHLTLPADVSMHLGAETFSGSIRSDFGAVKDQEYGPGSHLDVTTGNGDGQTKVETFSGDIELRRD